MPLVSRVIIARTALLVVVTLFLWVKIMHYYQFNIGDYLSHTRHLTPIEDICYRRALDYYYLHEKPLINDVAKLSRLLLLADYVNELNLILNEFFVLTENGYINLRADKEIKQYQSFSESGKRGANKRWGTPPNSPPNSPPNEPPLANNKQEPLTKNQEPPTTAGAICKKIISIGINPVTINQNNPTFLALIDAGATIGEFEYAAMEAKRKNQGFNYILGIVKGERERAKDLDIHKGKMPEILSAKDAERKSVTQAAFGNLLKQYEVNEKDITNEVTIPNF